MLQDEHIVVIGASGFGRESLDVLRAMKEDGAAIEISGVIDDAPSASNLGRLKDLNVPYLGTLDHWLAGPSTNTKFVLGIGSPSVKRKIARKLEKEGFTPYTAIHPSAEIGSNPSLGPGAVVCAGAVVSTNVRFGKYVHINPHATIGHDATLEDFVSVNPAAVISGEVRIHDEVLVGAGAIILQQLTVERGVVVGAAALVTKNVPPDVIVKGVPGVWNA
ncbi:acetyltransferase [Corynebacterium marinum DSM 44953]|uniref:Acetyltransferase n=2 Tax=Corynebacterium marinum TaxID=349751 RepID=A0A0B6TT38_9CORY|nr:acetyltransferase [Corynebacterium marinum DSM 44953]